MTRCSQTVLVQDFLDGELRPREALAYRTHLAGCAECAAEVAAFQRVYSTLAGVPLPTPAVGLTDRILTRVLPSRRRARRLVALGWSYAAALAACVGAVVLWWALDPGRHALVTMLPAEASRRLLGVGLFVLNALGSSAVRLADSWGWAHAIGVRLAPLVRALGAVLGQPGIGLTVWAAAAVCAALLWWMRPRPAPAAREVRHVSVLGF